MNLIGYDAMTVGNHEFDNPLDIIRKQQRWANFPFVSANIYDRQTGRRLFDPWTMFEFDGVKVAVMGLTTEDTAVPAHCGRAPRPRRVPDRKGRETQTRAGRKRHQPTQP